MLQQAFSAAVAKTEVTAAIRDIESATSAEVVVAVRTSAGSYRHTDYLVGFAFSLVALLVFLYHPVPFNDDWMPPASLVAFTLGALLSSRVAPFRRLFTSRRLMQENARQAARAAFVDLRVGATGGRTGILVFVALFEGRVEVVADIGIDQNVLGPSFEGAVQALTASLRAGAQPASFLASLRALGPLLAEAHPRRADDVNELPDQSQA